MTPPEYLERQRLFAATLPEQKLDAALITDPISVRYLTGFTGSNSMLVVTPTTTVIFTDPRYAIQVKNQAQARFKKVVRGPLITQAAQWLKARHKRKTGIEKDHLTFGSLMELDSKLPKRYSVEPLNEALSQLRHVKSPEEIEQVRKAVALNSLAFERAVKRFKPSMTESEFAAEIDHQMRLLGAEAQAFETIVASGKHSALPHARPRNVRIGESAIVLVDMGAQFGGYMSDMTRMLHVGEPPKRFLQLHQAVLRAQLAGVAAVRAGTTAGKVDKAAREVLKAAKLDKQFVHSTGHGLGLEIHEGPRLGKGEKTELKAGMLITIEPGAYVEGFGGVRIEDTVLVTETGCEILTPTSKELRIV